MPQMSVTIAEAGKAEGGSTNPPASKYTHDNLLNTRHDHNAQLGGYQINGRGGAGFWHLAHSGCSFARLQVESIQMSKN